jgi:3',5'-nucleoside bisphosphate phosphatase
VAPGYSCDLHIHSALSPCGSLDMSPRNIVMRAKEVGLNVIAITDHNMVENAAYAYEIGKASGTSVLIGMELQTIEEIHLLAIFDSIDTGMDFQKKIYDLLPPVKNDPAHFGDQVIVDQNDEIVRFEEKLLLNSAQISIEDAVSWIGSHGGLAIASHVDSQMFSLISQLGYVPEDIPFDALEVRNANCINEIIPLTPGRKIPFVTFSDAHYVDDIGKRRMYMQLDKPNCSEIKKALNLLRIAA